MRSRIRLSLAFALFLSFYAALPATAAPRDDDQPRTFVQRVVRAVRYLQHLITTPLDDSGTIIVPKP
jgi:hypothetical protein